MIFVPYTLTYECVGSTADGYSRTTTVGWAVNLGVKEMCKCGKPLTLTVFCFPGKTKEINKKQKKCKK
jgi:hypothetical protein